MDKSRGNEITSEESEIKLLISISLFNIITAMK